VLVTAAFCTANAVVVESALSFLRLGPGANLASWGGLLEQARQHAHLGAWHLWLFPVLALAVAVTCCHRLADDLGTRRSA
jgi:ABC-type dipeptide/oligopeptide/nickel transport system permease subunit